MVSGSVVEPAEVVGALTVEFSVLTQVIVLATAVASITRTILVMPFGTDVVSIVIVMAEADELVNRAFWLAIGTVPALLVTAMALTVGTMADVTFIKPGLVRMTRVSGANDPPVPICSPLPMKDEGV